MAADDVFVDTNALVYASQQSARDHARALTALGDLAAAGCALWISPQILREYMVVMTRSSPPVSIQNVVNDVAALRARFNLTTPRVAILDRLLLLVMAYPTSGKTIHDANIVATMLEHSITRLLTFNTSDFQRFVPSIQLEPLPP